MADYVCIDQFRQGWTFFIEKIGILWGKFPCSEFSCSGCDDWLDCENQNRKVKKIWTHFFQVHQAILRPTVLFLTKVNFLNFERNFQPKLESQLGEGGQAKVFKAKFHGKDVAMKYIPLDHKKDNYEYHRGSYGCHEFNEQEMFINHSWILTLSRK